MEDFKRIFKMSDERYDRMKWIAQIGIPVIAGLYFGISKYVPLPAAENVVGILMEIDLALGVILGISSLSYHKEIELKQQYQNHTITAEDKENDRA